MAKGIYVGIGGVGRKMKTPYIEVGGVVRKVKKVFIGVGGVKLSWGGEIRKYTGNITPLTKTNDMFYNFNAQTPCLPSYSVIFYSNGNFDTYNLSLVWNLLYNANLGRQYACLGSLPSLLLMFGGNPGGGLTNSVATLNNSLVVGTAASRQFARGKSSASTIGNYSVVTGGVYNTSNQSGVSEVDAYNSTLTRTSLESWSDGYEIGCRSNKNYALFYGGSSRVGSRNHNLMACDKNLVQTKLNSQFSLLGSDEACSFAIDEYVGFNDGRMIDGSLVISKITLPVTSQYYSSANTDNYAILSGFKFQNVTRKAISINASLVVEVLPDLESYHENNTMRDMEIITNGNSVLMAGLRLTWGESNYAKVERYYED